MTAPAPSLFQFAAADVDLVAIISPRKLLKYRSHNICIEAPNFISRISLSFGLFSLLCRFQYVLDIVLSMRKGFFIRNIYFLRFYIYARYLFYFTSVNLLKFIEKSANWANIGEHCDFMVLSAQFLINISIKSFYLLFDLCILLLYQAYILSDKLSKLINLE